MDRGEVVRVELPPPQGQSGREQIGKRPAVVVQVPAASANLSTVILVPLTGQLHNARHFGSVVITATPENGLDVDSVALIHQLRAIDRKRILATLGRITDDDLHKINSKIRDILGL